MFIFDPYLAYMALVTVLKEGNLKPACVRDVSAVAFCLCSGHPASQNTGQRAYSEPQTNQCLWVQHLRSCTVTKRPNIRKDPKSRPGSNIDVQVQCVQAEMSSFLENTHLGRPWCQKEFLKLKLMFTE